MKPSGIATYNSEEDHPLGKEEETQTMSGVDVQPHRSGSTTSKRKTAPNDKMRLFMDHAQRTVDSKKWPAATIASDNRSVASKPSFLSNSDIGVDPFYSNFSLQGSQQPSNSIVSPREMAETRSSGSGVQQRSHSNSLQQQAALQASPTINRQPPSEGLQPVLNTTEMTSPQRTLPPAVSPFSPSSAQVIPPTQSTQPVQTVPLSQMGVSVPTMAPTQTDQSMQIGQGIEEMDSDLGASSQLSSRRNSTESFVTKPVRRTKRRTKQRTDSIDSQQTTSSMVINPSPKHAVSKSASVPSINHAQHAQHAQHTQHAQHAQHAQHVQHARSMQSPSERTSIQEVKGSKHESVALKKRREEPHDMMKNDVEQFVASLSSDIHRMKSEYAKQVVACEEVVKDKDRLVQRMDVISKRDSLERAELNKKLENRFDRNVISKTTAINDLISECNEELEVMNTKRSSSFFEKVLSFIFTSLIEGLSYLGFLPLSILSFCKYIFMMFIQDNNEQSHFLMAFDANHA